ncbi:hypothetical protein GF324_05110 [bacterium]|nr:hypothetical protein [bacterium]
MVGSISRQPPGVRLDLRRSEGYRRLDAGCDAAGGVLLLKRVVVLGLDGTPFSLLKERMQRRPDSIWDRLQRSGRLIRIRSTRPEVSSVAWASYLTGADPGEHGLLGFVDRHPRPFQLYFPNGASLQTPTVLDKVHNAGGTVISINVPATFPPKPLRGLVIGGFLGVHLDANVHPQDWLPRLQQLSYTIDVDPAGAYKDKAAFLDQLEQALEARVRVALEAAERYDWNLLQLHIMETDRLFHFFWDAPDWEPRFHRLLDRVDDAVETFSRLAARENASLVVLSDHGFTRTRKIFFLNRWLMDEGYLQFNGVPSWQTISDRTRAYALVPGRVFLAMRGRESFGSVAFGTEAERLRDELLSRLSAIRDPDTGLPVFREVLAREDVYHGLQKERAAEVLAFPEDGIDLKADLDTLRLFEKPTTLVGTHTYGNAFVYTNADDPKWKDAEASIIEVGQYVQRLLGV